LVETVNFFYQEESLNISKSNLISNI